MKRTLTSISLILALFLSLLPSAFAAEDSFAAAAPSGLVATEDGYLITDVYNKVVWKVTADGTAVLLAGQICVSDVSGEPIGSTADGTLATALFENPWGIAPFLNGYLISEPDSNVIRYIDDKSVQTAVGNGAEGKWDGYGLSTAFSCPTGLAAGDQGEVYIADTGNGAIRRLDPDGRVTTVFTGLNEPTGIYWWNGALYVAETGSHCISKIENGKRTVLIGSEGDDGYTDGYVKAARMRDPQGVVVAEDGTIYFSDTGNHAVRCLRGEQVFTVSKDETVMMPRSLMLIGDNLLVADPFSRTVWTIALTETRFTDVAEGSWYEEAISESVRRGLFNGVGDNRFDPEGTTNRAMLAKMLGNLQNQLDRDIVLNGDTSPSDVSRNDWYGDVACWAVSSGYMDAENGVFDPMHEITREEMTLALFRFAAALGADTSARADLSLFKDAGLVTEQDAMSWAVASGLIRGMGGNELSPHTTTTRAQMVQVMIRFMDLLQKN